MGKDGPVAVTKVKPPNLNVLVRRASYKQCAVLEGSGGGEEGRGAKGSEGEGSEGEGRGGEGRREGGEERDGVMNEWSVLFC